MKNYGYLTTNLSSFLLLLLSLMVLLGNTSSQTQPYPPHHPKNRQQQQQQQQQQHLYSNQHPVVSTATIDPYYAASPTTFAGGHYSPQPHHIVQQRRRRQQQDEDGSNAAVDTGQDLSYEGQLRSALLENYDRNAFPYETVWDAQVANGQTKTGMNVEFSLNFHKVHALNVAESTAHFVVWVQERWKDPRLTWDPEEYNNVTKTWFYIEDGMGGGEVSEIWTPDIYLWNQEESMDVTLANTYAGVEPDGTVYWSRPGLIKATCKFRGLGGFPFDNLRCTLEFGSWARNGMYIRPTLMGEGFSVGGSETAGQSFAEFSLKTVAPSVYVYPPFPNDPLGDWPVLLYEVECSRASRPYVRGYLLLQIMLNFCAFACMWIPPQVGERMGLAITSLLAAVASELAVSEQLPNSREINWFVIFSMSSMMFSVLVVFQSTAVIYFYYFTGSDLRPFYVKWMQDKWRLWRSGDKTEKPNTDESEASESRARAAEETSEMDMTDHMNANLTKANGAEEQIGHNSANSRVSFDMGSSLEEERKSRLQSAQLRGMNMSLTSIIPRHDAEDFKDARARQNNLRWQRVSRRIDDYSRLIIPILYFIFLAVILAKAGKSPSYTFPTARQPSYVPGSLDDSQS